MEQPPMARRFQLMPRALAHQLRAATKSLRLACAESATLCHPAGVLAGLCRTKAEKQADTVAAGAELAKKFEAKLEQLDPDVYARSSVR